VPFSSHLVFVLKLSVAAESPAPESGHCQSQSEGKTESSEILLRTVFKVPSEITHAGNIRTWLCWSETDVRGYSWKLERGSWCLGWWVRRIIRIEAYEVRDGLPNKTGKDKTSTVTAWGLYHVSELLSFPVPFPVAWNSKNWPDTELGMCQRKGASYYSRPRWQLHWESESNTSPKKESPQSNSTLWAFLSGILINLHACSVFTNATLPRYSLF
jgi:hypothetical protein